MKTNRYLLIIPILFISISLHAQTWQELFNTTWNYIGKQDYKNALHWGEKTLARAEKEVGKQGINYARSMITITEIWMYSGNLDSALIYGAKAMETSRRAYKTEHQNIARSIKDMGFIYHLSGDSAKGEPLLKEALEMYRRIYKTDHPDLAWNITHFGTFYTTIGNIYKAEPLFKEALEMYRRIYKTDHPILARSIQEMGKFYIETGDFTKSEALLKEALEMHRRIYKTDHPDLAWCIHKNGELYLRTSDCAKAEPLLREALEMSRRIYKTDNPDLAECLQDMGSLYQEIGDFTKAEALLREALEMSRRIYKTDHLNLAGSIISMGLFFKETSNLVKAEPLYKESLKMARRIFKTDNPSLAWYIIQMAVFYNITARYAKAEILYKEALEISRRMYKSDSKYLAKAIHAMAFFYMTIGDYNKAEALYKEALEMSRRIYKTDHPDLAGTIAEMGPIYQNLGDFEKAEPLLKEALVMSRRMYKTDHPSLAIRIHNLASFYKETGDYAKSEPLYKESIEILKRIYKTDHWHSAQYIYDMAFFYINIGDYARAEPIFNESIIVYQNLIKNYFPSLSEQEKKQFWNNLKIIFNTFNSFVVKRVHENPNIISNMYNMQLYRKPLLFNTSGKIKSRILNSNDSALIVKYYQWSDKKDFLVKLYSMTEDSLKKKGFDIDSIETLANELEKELTMKSEDFKQAYEKKKYSWRVIQAVLQPDEAAVEVIRFKKIGKVPNIYKPELMINNLTDTVCYAFLIVSENTEEHPELVVLENGRQLENEYYNYYRRKIKSQFEDLKSYTRYWEKLHEKLKGYKKIYFSADGIYNKLNPATFLMPDGRYLLDIYDIQQLNSTKDILLGFYETKQESNIYNSAVLIGNPNFALSEEEVRKASERIRTGSQESEIWEPLANIRGIQLTRLPGTEKEIQDIEKFLESREWNVKSYLGDMALKTAVKTANSPRVLHIATHGMFLEDVKHESSQMFGFNEERMVANPLLRSGLFFTGADNYLKAEDEKPTGDVNGILTAYEAMNLNLDHTELVVLSACETGLGEIRNGEGVFGLRRAFQTAGAKTVVMSLWTVSDQATQELMSSFYSNWVTGMTKREAFKKAQQEIREKYHDPYYWGAFVMVGE